MKAIAATIDFPESDVDSDITLKIRTEDALSMAELRRLYSLAAEDRMPFKPWLLGKLKLMAAGSTVHTNGSLAGSDPMTRTA